MNTTAMKITPVRDRILVRRDPEPDTTPEGLHLPSNRKRAGDVVIGTVKAVPAKPTCELCCKAGDRIIFGSFAGTIADPDDRDLILMSNDDVQGIVEG